MYFGDLNSELPLQKVLARKNTVIFDDCQPASQGLNHSTWFLTEIIHIPVNIDPVTVPRTDHANEKHQSFSPITSEPTLQRSALFQQLADGSHKCNSSVLCHGRRQNVACSRRSAQTPINHLLTGTSDCLANAQTPLLSLFIWYYRFLPTIWLLQNARCTRKE